MNNTIELYKWRSMHYNEIPIDVVARGYELTEGRVNYIYNHQYNEYYDDEAPVEEPADVYEIDDRTYFKWAS